MAKAVAREQQYLDTFEAAAFLNLSPYTLEAWRYRGGGPRYCKFGKSVRYARAVLEAYAEGKARENTSQLAA